MEIVVLSGKGGTGKTTIAIALSELAKNIVKVDCDVDAPNLYLFYDGKNKKREDFFGGKKAVLNKELCVECGACDNYCKFDAIKKGVVNPLKCEGCGACTLVCPNDALRLEDEKGADVFITETSKGYISRAEMEIGSDASGKLITVLRKKGEEIAKDNDLIIVDGSPGIGCPVISSITGCSMALIVTEPTKSGMQDFMRIIEVCKYFGIKALVCINKYDINKKVTKEIEDFCKENKYPLVGKIPYDDTVMKSINELKPIIYYENSSANKAIREMWEKASKILELKVEN